MAKLMLGLGLRKRAKSAIRRASGVLLRELPLFRRVRGDSFDVIEAAFFAAALESASFYQDNMLTSDAFENDLALLSHAMGIAPAHGMILEFGVATGRTINHIARLTDRHVDGFDSFSGLPEDWRTGFSQGAFAQAMPAVPGNVSLHKGWFSDTLPSFLDGKNERVALLHVDCDLYSSTAFILKSLKGRIRCGTVIVFDEYFNYPGWKQHEHKAFQEFIAKTGLSFRYDSFVPSHQQVCAIIA
jgi:Macrocin-O-methyltransferase (TylF)